MPNFIVQAFIFIERSNNLCRGNEVESWQFENVISTRTSAALPTMPISGNKNSDLKQTECCLFLQLHVQGRH